MGYETHHVKFSSLRAILTKFVVKKVLKWPKTDVKKFVLNIFSAWKFSGSRISPGDQISTIFRHIPFFPRIVFPDDFFIKKVTKCLKSKSFHLEIFSAKKVCE